MAPATILGSDLLAQAAQESVGSGAAKWWLLVAVLAVLTVVCAGSFVLVYRRTMPPAKQIYVPPPLPTREEWESAPPPDSPPFVGLAPPSTADPLPDFDAAPSPVAAPATEPVPHRWPRLTPPPPPVTEPRAIPGLSRLEAPLDLTHDAASIGQIDAAVEADDQVSRR